MTNDDRSALLKLARAAIAGELAGQAVDTIPTTPELGQPQGVFVTLRLSGAVRGCIGFTKPTHPLYRGVALAAASAAFRDSRYPPVVADELPKITIEISALSPLVVIATSAIEVGTHGLMISEGGKWAAMLPQAATENKWTREQFLAATCKKAGLPANAWQTGASIQGFTAEVFSEGATQ